MKTLWGPSPLALKAMRHAIRESHLYPDDNCFALRTALAEKFGVQPAEIVLGNGSVEILPQITLAYLGPGSSAVVSEGAFIWYKIAVTSPPASSSRSRMKNLSPRPPGDATGDPEQHQAGFHRQSQ